jgi:phytoene dehydrogenase-like protein
MAVGSPFFRGLGLEQYGLEWVHPAFPLVHPLPDGNAAVMHRSVEATAEGLGRGASVYNRLMGPIVSRWEEIAEEILQPLPHIPRHPVELAHFGIRAMWPAQALIDGCLREEKSRALFAGLAAHSFLPLTAIPSGAFGLVLGMMGHGVGWPFPRGGAQGITSALVECLRDAGGEVECNSPVRSLAELPPARAIMLDVSPRQFLQVAGDNLPPGYRRALARYRPAPGIFKIDYALDGPVPWLDASCHGAGTLHICGTAAEVAASEQAVAGGRIPDRPFVLAAQHTPFDPSRAPAGKQTFWAYCHIPYGSIFDMTSRIEAQIERFAPGFRDRILARHTMGPVQLEEWNPNLAGGDISGGACTPWQMLARPIASATPYRTPLTGVYLCSASTPPGGGVHGMCGFHAARAAFADVFA